MAVPKATPRSSIAQSQSGFTKKCKSTPSKSSNLTSGRESATLSGKMRSWTSSRLISNFYLPHATTASATPRYLAFNHWPTAPASSPNGLPEAVSIEQTYNPLSGPTTRRGDYILSCAPSLSASSLFSASPLPSPSSSPAEWNPLASSQVFATAAPAYSTTSWNTVKKSCKGWLNVPARVVFASSDGSERHTDCTVDHNRKVSGHESGNVDSNRSPLGNIAMSSTESLVILTCEQADTEQEIEMAGTERKTEAVELVREEGSRVRRKDERAQVTIQIDDAINSDICDNHHRIAASGMGMSDTLVEQSALNSDAWPKGPAHISLRTADRKDPKEDHAAEEEDKNVPASSDDNRGFYSPISFGSPVEDSETDDKFSDDLSIKASDYFPTPSRPIHIPSCNTSNPTFHQNNLAASFSTFSSSPPRGFSTSAPRPKFERMTSSQLSMSSDACDRMTSGHIADWFTEDRKRAGSVLHPNAALLAKPSRDLASATNEHECTAHPQTTTHMTKSVETCADEPPENMAVDLPTNESGSRSREVESFGHKKARAGLMGYFRGACQW